MGGLIFLAARKIRDTSINFCRDGCPHIRIEYIIAQLNRLLLHYDCDNNTGLKLAISLKYMLTELGVLERSFHKSYKQYQSWITPS